MHPNESLDELADFKCEAEECSAVFQLKSQLAAHVKAEHRPPSVAHHCSECDREFTTKVFQNQIDDNLNNLHKLLLIVEIFDTSSATAQKGGVQSCGELETCV